LWSGYFIAPLARDSGKFQGKVVRIALAHKLLVRLNAKAREVRQRLAVLQQNPMALSEGSL
jgi:hypothetical protein